MSSNGDKRPAAGPAGDLTPTPAYHPFTLDALALLSPGATPAPGRMAMAAGLDCTALHCTDAGSMDDPRPPGGFPDLTGEGVGRRG
jgi:hypothetical protein